ncbi:hypothetical protein NXW24_20825 [Bacteroides fragilis]|nr:hypothetical protein [Bacteroides fragilis]
MNIRAKVHTLQPNAINYFSGEEIARNQVTKNKMSMDWQGRTPIQCFIQQQPDMIGRTINMLSGALVGTSYEHYKYERLAGSREGNFHPTH